MEYLAGFVALLVELPFPLLLLPLLTWTFGGLIVADRSDEIHVQFVACCLSAVGFAGLFWLYLMPLSRPQVNPWWDAARTLAIATKQAITELHGNSLVWSLSMELAFVQSLIELSGTEQEWINTVRRAMFSLFVALVVLAIVALVLYNIGYR